MKKFLIWGIAVLVAAIAIEQTFLYFLTKRILADDETFSRYINEFVFPDYGEEFTGTFLRETCKVYPVVRVYDFKLCAIKARSIESKSVFAIKFQYPAGYLSLVRNDPDRIFYGSEHTLNFDEDRNITLDRREKE